MKKINLSLLFIIPFLASCANYQQTGSGCGCTPVAVELIKNDDRGLLRNALAARLSESRKFAYTSSATSRAKLVVDITKDSAENVGQGVIRDPKTKAMGDKFIPTEANRTLFAKVSVVDRDNGKDLIEPFVVSASVDFDFVEPTSVNAVRHYRANGDETTLLQYSMGQLDSRESALGESASSIYDQLSKKIIIGLKRAKTLN